MPLLIPDVEEFTHRWLKQELVNRDGVYVHEIGGTENHVHLCIEIVPTVLISELIGQLKQWKAGFGVVSFGAGDRDWVMRYIRSQRTHHARGNIQDRLERITHPDD